MAWRTKLDEWARWTAVRLNESSTIPSPRYWRHDVPWMETFLNLLGEDGPPADLRSAFEDATAGDDAFAARFVGLDLCHRLVHQDPFPLQEELLEDARRNASEHFRWLVDIASAADVPADRRRIDWELRLCCPLRMWDRADALLDRLDDLVLADGEANLLRAQHLFLRRYYISEGDSVGDAYIDECLWGAWPAEEIVTAFLFLAAVSTTRPVADSPAPSPEIVYGAVQATAWRDRPWLTPLLEARPLFELGLYSDAVARFTAVLDDKTFDLSRELLYEALSLTYDRIGGLSRQVFLDRWSLEFPGDHRVAMKLAQAAADSADYHKAYRCLVRAVSLQPELESDTATRIGLALGEIASAWTSNWNELKSAIEKYPEIEAIQGVIRTYWVGFGSLEPNERLEWIAGLYTIHVVAPKTGALAAAWCRQAGLAFLTVAECQLRRNLFEPIQRDAQNDPTWMEFAKSIPKADPDYIFARYLASFKGDITLGQMLRILEDGRSRRFGGPLGGLLSKHVSKSPILAQIDALQRLDKPRNEAVHHLTTVDALALHDDARRVIDAVVVHDRTLKQREMDQSDRRVKYGVQ